MFRRRAGEFRISLSTSFASGMCRGNLFCGAPRTNILGTLEFLPARHALRSHLFTLFTHPEALIHPVQSVASRSRQKWLARNGCTFPQMIDTSSILIDTDLAQR